MLALVLAKNGAARKVGGAQDFVCAWAGGWREVGPLPIRRRHPLTSSRRHQSAALVYGDGQQVLVFSDWVG